MAWTGAAFAVAAALAGAGVAGALLLRAHPTPRRGHSLRDTVFTLRAGQCADTAPNGIGRARVTPCADAHQLEVFGVYQVSAPGRGWPGAATLASQARSGCLRLLSGYLNPQLATSGLTEVYVYPDRGAWDVGERSVICEVRSVNGPPTGSVRASG